MDVGIIFQLLNFYMLPMQYLDFYTYIQMLSYVNSPDTLDF